MNIVIDARDRNLKIVNLVHSGKKVASVRSNDTITGINKLLRRQGISFKNIKKFEIVNEPGSFTGLKAGASIANALNYALGYIKKPKDLINPNYGGAPNIFNSKKTHPTEQCQKQT